MYISRVNAIFISACFIVIAGYCLFYSYDAVTPQQSYTVLGRYKSFDFSLSLPVLFSEVLTDFSYNYSSININAKVIFFKRMIHFPIWRNSLIGSKCSIIANLQSADVFASKSSLYKVLRSIPDVHEYVPVTYILKENQDMIRLQNDIADPNIKAFIIKKNIQRQKGCLISRNEKVLMSAHENGYVVAQRLLTNNLLINDRKINLRCYVTIVVTTHECTANIFDDGFVYYSPEIYDDMSISAGVHITSGLQERQIYENVPLTIQDLFDHLNNDLKTSIEKNIIRVLKKVFEKLLPLIHSQDAIKGKTCFTIAGCDLSVDKTGGVKLMEINKGPDLSPKDDRDETLKRDLVKCVFNKVGIISYPNNRMREIVSHRKKILDLSR